MKLIIAGSRSITDKSTVKKAFRESPFSWTEVSEIVSGEADGVDSIGEELADNHEETELQTFPAEDYFDEAPNPRVAPLIRNGKMAEYGDALLAVWDGESSGTEDMITKAERENLTIHIHRTDTHGLTDFS